MTIKTGDNVRILTGKDKGKTGKVIQVFPKMNKVVVEGANKAVKHVRKRGNAPGQRIEYDAPVHVSNVVKVKEEKKPKATAKKTATKKEKETK